MVRKRPSERLDDKKRAEEEKQEKKTKDKPLTPEQKLDLAYKKVSASEAGRQVFTHLMQECGFKEPSIVANPATGEINFNSTVYNESKRAIWLRTRSRIPAKWLNLIEQEK